jgi:hypothetical protein
VSNGTVCVVLKMALITIALTLRLLPYQYYDIRNNEHVKITYTSEQITLHFSGFFLKERLILLTPDLTYAI